MTSCFALIIYGSVHDVSSDSIPMINIRNMSGYVITPVIYIFSDGIPTTNNNNKDERKACAISGYEL